MRKVEDIFEENLKAIRASLGLSQNAMAERLGVSLTGYQKFEYGDRFPRVTQLNQIAKKLGTTVGALLSEQDDKPIELVVHVQEEAYDNLSALTPDTISDLFRNIPVPVLRKLSGLKLTSGDSAALLVSLEELEKPVKSAEKKKSRA